MTKKDEEIYELENLIQTTSTVICDKCNEEETIEADDMEAADCFYRGGWRVINDETVCKKCRKKPNKNLKNEKLFYEFVF